MKPAPEVTFRAAEAADLDSLVSIERSAFPNAWSRDALEYWIAHPCALVRVAIGDSGIQGFTVMIIDGRTLHLANLAVREERRRQGVGLSMLLHSIDTARGLGLDDVHLEVRESNLSAQLLYRRAGFRAERVLRRYYGTEDGYFMRHSLSAIAPDEGVSTP